MSRLITLLLLLLPILSIAQDYQCIIPGQKQYFINSYGYLKGIDIDSVKTIGSSTIIYPYQSQRGDYELHVFMNFPQKGGHWLGKTITVAPDGTHTFENYWGGTLQIKAQAALNETWNLYTDVTDTFYTATITSIDTMSFANVHDSVKRITLHAYNSSGALTSDPLHNTEIIISKQYGFVRVCDLYMFPLHAPGLSYQKGFDYLHDISSRDNTDIFFNQFNFRNPSRHEIHDFNVGDRFLKRYSGTTEMMQLKIVSDKQIVSPSEIRYKISTWEEKRKPLSVQKETTGYLEDLVVFNTPLLSNIYMPEQWGAERYFIINTSKQNCVDTTYGIRPYAQCGEGQYFAKGLGQVEYDYCDDPTPSNQLYVLLNSWEKGTISCGGYPALAVETPYVGGNISIYPNPADGYTDLYYPIANSNIMLLDLDGKTLSESRISGSNYRLDLRTVPAGMYIIAVQNGNSITHSKLMVQH